MIESLERTSESHSIPVRPVTYHAPACDTLPACSDECAETSRYCASGAAPLDATSAATVALGAAAGRGWRARGGEVGRNFGLERRFRGWRGCLGGLVARKRLAGSNLTWLSRMLIEAGADRLVSRLYARMDCLSQLRTRKRLARGMRRVSKSNRARRERCESAILSSCHPICNTALALFAPWCSCTRSIFADSSTFGGWPWRAQ